MSAQVHAIESVGSVLDLHSKEGSLCYLVLRQKQQNEQSNVFCCDKSRKSLLWGEHGKHSTSFPLSQGNEMELGQPLLLEHRNKLHFWLLLFKKSYIETLSCYGGGRCLSFFFFCLMFKTRKKQTWNPKTVCNHLLKRFCLPSSLCHLFSFKTLLSVPLLLPKYKRIWGQVKHSSWG